MKKQIRLCYRKIIDSNSTTAWDRFVFEDSYKEFLLQAQLYNREKKYASFSDLILHVPGADKLHFLVSAAVTGYLKQLNGKVPGIVNNLGMLFLPFDNYRFEIVNSNIKDQARHQVAISFFSPYLTWHETIGNQLLISLPVKDESDETLTEMFSMQPFLSIYSLKEKP